MPAAREAFDAGPWPRTPARERARVLHRVADLVRERADEIAAVESLDVGKPVSLSRGVDVETVAETYEYYSALAQSLDGVTRQVVTRPRLHPQGARRRGGSDHPVQLPVDPEHVEMMDGKPGANPLRGLGFPKVPVPFYNGTPWFLPFGGAYYKAKDRLR